MIFEEFVKCSKDFVYFAEKYLKINHPKKGLIPFTLFDYQKRLISDYESHNYVITAKWRQGGFSTLTVLHGLWHCMFKPDSRFLFISKTDREARALSKVVENAINNLPDTFKPLLTKSNDHEKRFECTGSIMNFFSPEPGCGRAFTHLIIDEAAFIRNMDEHWKAMWPQIQGKCFVLSTVNGIGNWFAETYIDAREGKNKFKVFESSYKEHPEYNNEEWVAQVRKNLGERGWMQEFECCFVGSEPTKEDKLRYKLMQILNDNKLLPKDMIKGMLVTLMEYET
jgi:hypothetical protein